MKLMIHACAVREWYVREFLIPSLYEQGIAESEVSVWIDSSGKGNLTSCVESFASCNGGETWHLQDDVIICRDFGKRTRAAPDGLVCGFCVDLFEDTSLVGRRTTAEFMWQSSFPCIKIPDHLANEFAEWVTNEAMARKDLHRYVKDNKKDDTLFYIFMNERHPEEPVSNLSPHLVDHIDYLIGGSVLNPWRGYIAQSSQFDKNLIRELKEKLASR